MKSILLLFAGSMLAAAPMAISGHLPQQAPAAGQAAPQPAAPAPDQSATQTPVLGETPLASQPTATGAVKADSMKNPVKATTESQAKAKQLYAIDCALCHGDNGNGKTDVATSMGLTLSDFSDPKTLGGRMDGELFNIIRNGKGKMPGEDAARAKDDEVWNLIIYVRKFAPASGTPVAAVPASASK